MTTERFHWQLDKFVKSGKLPIYVERVARGMHPELQFHDHNCSEIAVILDGTAVHRVVIDPDIEKGRHHGKQEKSEIAQGDILVIHPGIVHAYDKTGDMELLNIVYDSKQLPLPILDGYMLPLFRIFFPQKFSDQARNTARPVTRLTRNDLRKALPAIRELQSETETFKPGSIFRSLALFMDIVVTVARLCSMALPTKSREQFLVGCAIRFIMLNFSKPVTLDQMAHTANMSRRNFCRHFRSMVGTSPTNYLLQVRMNHAAELLITTDLNLSEIAEDCGFCDSNYLCRKFRQEQGVSPLKFRKKNNSKGIQC